MIKLVARQVETEKKKLVLTSPAIGCWKPRLDRGFVIESGDVLGTLMVLGKARQIHAGAQTRGLFVSIPQGDIAFGDLIGEMVDEHDFNPDTEPNGKKAAALTFQAPTSGRFYSRATPEKPPFVEVGDVIAPGHVVCLIEVMKTFNRIEYSGEGPVKVLALVPADGDDLESDDVILELERVS